MYRYYIYSTDIHISTYIFVGLPCLAIMHCAAKDCSIGRSGVMTAVHSTYAHYPLAPAPLPSPASLLRALLAAVVFV